MVIGAFSTKKQRLSPSPTSNKYPYNNTWNGQIVDLVEVFTIHCKTRKIQHKFGIG
jgi:hypothetical protein